MLRPLIIGLLLAFTFHSSAFAQIVLEHKEISNQRNCYRGIFENYDTWFNRMKKGNQRKAKTPEELEIRLSKLRALFSKIDFNKFKNSIHCVTFQYIVEDVLVDGYLIKPKNQTNLPILIYNRGGNARYGAMIFGSMLASLFPIAESGFAIIGSQYRGAFDRNTIKGKSDEFGGADVTDVVKLMDFIPHIEGVNANRVGMYGASRGGMQTFLALQQLPTIKAVASIAGVSDLLRRLEKRPSMEEVYNNRIPNYATNKISALEKRSVLKWADKLDKNVPILLQHGDQDKKVSVENAKWLAQSLTKLEHPHTLSIYEGEGHSWSPKTKPIAMKELTDWFHQHL
jgi:dipeptidyl aminopeptidase/acylaminoacyl peptidase